MDDMDYLLSTKIFIEFSRVQQSFGHALSQFRFKTIGTEQTEDEQRICKLLYRM